MRYTTSVIAAAFVASASAHSRIYSAWINGVDQGDGRGTYVRSPSTNDPVKDLTSTNLVCNTAGSTAVADFVSAAAGDTVSMEWYHDSRGDDIIASSHKGPIITWIAEYFEDAGASAIWTKIAEAGYDSSSSTWATDALISAGGKANFTLPSNLKAGKYMIRQEIIALHEADTCYATAGSRGAQFYPSCVQFEVTGTGTATPDQAFDFNSNYNCSDAGIQFSIYNSFTSYPIPGPDAETSLSGSSSSGSSSNSGSSSSASTSASASVSVTPSTSTSSTSSSSVAAYTAIAQPSTTLATYTTAAAANPTKASCKRRKARGALRA